MAGGQILAFPIDFDRRPYNTLALPCECVIGLGLTKVNVRYWLSYLLSSSVVICILAYFVSLN